MKLLFKLGVWKNNMVATFLDHNNGELKEQRRRRQRERQKSNRFTFSKATPLHVHHVFFVHFLAVVASL